MYKEIRIIFLIVCSSILVVAANYETETDRQENNVDIYNRLLSNAYKVIEKYELQKGTFANIDYFKERSDAVTNIYNPKPLTTEGLLNRVKNYRELKLQRLDLVRFMIGYPKKIAPQDVAMMHATFDCRVKNISVNHSMDQECNALFIKHKNNAVRMVDNTLNNKSTSFFEAPQAPIKHAEKNIAIKTVEKAPKIAPTNVSKNIVSMMPIVEDGEKAPTPIKKSDTIKEKTKIADNTKTTLLQKVKKPFTQEAPKKILPQPKIAKNTETAFLSEMKNPLREETPKKILPQPKIADNTQIVPLAKMKTPLKQEAPEKILPQPKIAKNTQIVPLAKMKTPLKQEAPKKILYQPKIADNEKNALLYEIKGAVKNIANMIEIIEEGNTDFASTETFSTKQTQSKSAFISEKNPFREVLPKKVKSQSLADVSSDTDLVTGTVKTEPEEIEPKLLSYASETLGFELETPSSGTMPLREIVEKALNNNPDRMVAVAQYFNSKAQIGVAETGYYPNVNLVLGGGREVNRPFATRQEQFNTSGYNYSNSANFRFEQMLFDGFITAETVAQRIKQAKASRLNERRVGEEIILSAVQIYMQLRQFQKTVTAAQENLKALHDIESLVNMRFKLGDSNKTEKKYLEGRIASAEQNLINAKVGLGNAESSLEFITGEKLNFSAILPEIKKDTKFLAVEKILQQAFQKNTQVSALNSEKQAAEHQLEAVLGRYYPRLFFITEAGYVQDRGGRTGDIKNSIVKLEMTLPIYDGGLRSDLARQQRAQIEEVEAKQIAFKRRLTQELKTSCQNSVGAVDQIETAIREIKSQLALEQLNKQQFKYGEKDIFITDLVESRERVFNAKINKIKAETQYITSYYSIQRSLGALFQDFCKNKCTIL